MTKSSSFTYRWTRTTEPHASTQTLGRRGASPRKREAGFGLAEARLPRADRANRAASRLEPAVPRVGSINSGPRAWRDVQVRHPDLRVLGRQVSSEVDVTLAAVDKGLPGAV